MPHPYGFPKYAVSHSLDTDADHAILGLFGGSSVRPWVYQLAVGFDATPADRRFGVDLVRTTDAGTAPAAALTAVPLDPLRAASQLNTGAELAGGAWIVEPSFSDVVVKLVAPQRRNVQWWAEPGCEVTHVLSSGDGLAVVTRNTPSINCNVVVHWYEETISAPV